MAELITSGGGDRFLVILLIVFFRYLIFASIAFLIFYVWKRKDGSFKKIQSRFPVVGDYSREFLYSVSTALIFAGMGYFVFYGPFAKYNLIYKNISEHSVVYFVFTIALILLIHDTYFYWAHRLMHHPRIFKYFHKVHHLSTNPSPWAAMAFHPLEAVVEFGIIAFVPYLFPIHPLAIFIFLLIMMIYNVYGHLGYELYPKGFSRSVVGKWINTSVNHNQHHEHFTGNYGLYFLWWDRWMGTLRKDYDEHFDAVKAKD